MKNLFTFVFSAGLGLTAAVGASSLNFGSFSVEDSVAGAQSAGVEFNAQNAAFGSTDGNVTLELSPFSDSTVSFFEVKSLRNPFEFRSIKVSTDILDGGQITAVGFLDGVEVVSEVLEAFNVPAILTPLSFVGKPLDRLRIGSAGSFPGGGGGSPSTTLFQDVDSSGEDDGKVSLDDLELVEIASVPVPASMLLFGTALAGFGVMRRRKKT
ncbi:VPLPA-CTERM sorting domain-containing protein [Roseobacter sp. YSTF-M11]|uniref:VPLPA-CTERM sorting domain-containing protein n=1 Tax=Roseobacter insulae TaxID=2859783 RepID=A0A9X1FZN8_9RHOB|nr:VPLPA-CTERM sorting domain-containing protein [Roseobacter insulae]MBW4710646.1 VPLPA-CTERM sorting domain-containing protein [Roseobacter insulae]